MKYEFYEVLVAMGMCFRGMCFYNKHMLVGNQVSGDIVSEIIGMDELYQLNMTVHMLICQMA